MKIKCIKKFYWKERDKWIDEGVETKGTNAKEWIKSGHWIELDNEWTESEIITAFEKHRIKEEEKTNFVEVEKEEVKEPKKPRRRKK
jgi:hypothetical protein